jgi:hypothetical protein
VRQGTGQKCLVRCPCSKGLWFLHGVFTRGAPAQEWGWGKANDMSQERVLTGLRVFTQLATFSKPQAASHTGVWKG